MASLLSLFSASAISSWVFGKSEKFGAFASGYQNEAQASSYLEQLIVLQKKLFMVLQSVFLVKSHFIKQNYTL